MKNFVIKYDSFPANPFKLKHHYFFIRKTQACEGRRVGVLHCHVAIDLTIKCLESFF